jgi:hypothetical protein
VNPYLTLDNKEPWRADRYYGRVDSVEMIDNQASESLIQLDAVAADSFDQEKLRGDPLTDAMDRLPLCVLEFSTLNVPSQVQASLRDDAQPGQWLQVQTATPSPLTVDVDYYPGLFADGVTLASQITRVDDKVARALSTAFGMDDLPDQTEARVASLLNSIAATDFITVYDVGREI